jgi:enamine deaminase RidA (YjgF/YER057c/UK114 family)
MSERQLIAAGSPWEKSVGYSRAVRVGQLVTVSGTTATDPEGRVLHPGDLYRQTRVALDRIGRALGEAGATFADVVRTRCFVTDIRRWEEVGRAHGEVFGEIRPATTMVEVRALIDPDVLVEVEADAIIGSGSPT